MSIKKKTKRQIVYEYLQASPGATYAEIARATGVARSSIGVALHILRAEGVVRVTGLRSGETGGTVYRYEASKEEEDARTSKEVVYEWLVDNGPATARETAKGTGLSRRAVSSAANELLSRDGLLVVVSKSRKGSGGAYTYQAASRSSGVSGWRLAELTVKLGGGPFGLMAAQLGAGA